MPPEDPGAPVVVAFDGGQVASYLVALHARAGRRVVAVTVDAGGAGPDGPDHEALARRARTLGADEHVVADAAEHVWERYVAWLVRGDVLLGGVYPPWVQAERYAEIDQLVGHARRVGATALAHPARGDDLVRLVAALRATAPELALEDFTTAPLSVRAWLEAQGLLDASGDADLGGPEVRAGAWGSVAVGGDLEDPWSSPESEVYPTVPAVGDAASLPEEFELEFTAGLPTACCGAAQDGPALVRAVARLARRHGVGRGLYLGEGPLGVVSRVAFEAPAATVMVRAHQELSRLVLTRRQLELHASLSSTYGDLFHRGLLHEPAMRDIERFFESTQRVVTGTVRVRLQRGAVAIVGVRSPAGLAGPEAWASDTSVDAQDARGWARVAALPGRVARCRDERSAREGRAPSDDEPA